MENALMTQRRTMSVFVTIAFLALYGFYCIWSVQYTNYGSWYEWNLRIFGAACIVVAACLIFSKSWGRYVMYVLAALYSFSWLYMIVYDALKQPQVFGHTTQGIIIGVIIVSIPTMGLIGSTVVVHKTLRPAIVGAGS